MLNPTENSSLSFWSNYLNDLKNDFSNHSAYGSRIYPLEKSRIDAICSKLSNVLSKIELIIPYLHKSNEMFEVLQEIIKRTGEESKLLHQFSVVPSLETVDGPNIVEIFEAKHGEVRREENPLVQYHNDHSKNKLIESKKRLSAQFNEIAVAMCLKICKKVNSIFPQSLNKKPLKIKLISIDEKIMNLDKRLEDDCEAFINYVQEKAVSPNLLVQLLTKNLRLRLEYLTFPLTQKFCKQLEIILEIFATYISDFDHDIRVVLSLANLRGFKLQNDLLEMALDLMNDDEIIPYISSGHLQKYDTNLTSIALIFRLLKDNIKIFENYSPNPKMEQELKRFLVKSFEVLISFDPHYQSKCYDSKPDCKYILKKFKKFIKNNNKLCITLDLQRLVRFFNTEVKIELKNLQMINLPLWELLNISMLSPFFHRLFVKDIENKNTTINLTKTEIPLEAFHLVLEFSREKKDEGNLNINKFYAYSLANYLQITPLINFYGAQIIEKFTREDFIDLSATLETEIGFDPDTKLKENLLEKMLMLIKEEEEFLIESQFFQIAFFYAKELNRLPNFANLMFYQLGYMYKQLQTAKNSEQIEPGDFIEFEKMIKETISAKPLEKKIKLLASAQDIHRLLPISQFLANLESYLIESFENDYISREITDKMIDYEVSGRFALSILCKYFNVFNENCSKVDGKLYFKNVTDDNFYSMISNTPRNKRLLGQFVEDYISGLKLAQTVKPPISFAEEIYKSLPFVLKHLIFLVNDYKSETERLNEIKLLLKSALSCQSQNIEDDEFAFIIKGVEIDLSDFDLRIDQVYALNGIEIDRLILKAKGWFDKTGFNSQEQYNIKQAFPNTSIKWI